MAQSISDSSSGETQVWQKRTALEKAGEITANETLISAVSLVADQSLVTKTPMASVGNDALCCEARNSLQVILSGAEILLEDHLGNLLAGQKELLTKMADNTYHLCNLLTTLLGPEEFKLEEITEERYGAVHRKPVKA